MFIKNHGPPPLEHCLARRAVSHFAVDRNPYGLSDRILFRFCLGEQLLDRAAPPKSVYAEIAKPFGPGQNWPGGVSMAHLLIWDYGRRFTRVKHVYCFGAPGYRALPSTAPRISRPTRCATPSRPRRVIRNFSEPILW